MTHNEAVEKAVEGFQETNFRGISTLSRHEIVEYSAICEVGFVLGSSRLFPRGFYTA